MSDDPRQMLAEGIKDRSDEEILSLMKEMSGSVEQGLDMVFDGMTQALNPDTAQDCVIGYSLTEDGQTHDYAVIVKDKQCTYEKRDPSDARVTLSLTVPDFLRLISGNLDGMQAFMSGKLKLRGDMMFAQQMQRMFNA
ncbi:MAG TPA: SCP2 sterol-binding domain-containing protein [Actinomycetota bacterium]|nr:SCP2 sterol-binding domain-containing protein [Actinomycetota bacterium]